ncbi:cyclic nucleotide-binding domain-containing protein [Chryseobacterium arthrosphaerae]|uniref:Crp/Fnr family transcriptional regulator n=1 Tax=Chryseobacterium arthrosphaerae TaxID=651561 RepID=UPI0031D3B50D
MKSLKNALLRYCDFSSDDLDFFFQYCHRKELKKDSVLLRKGQISDILIFIETGMLSIFLDHEGEQVNCAFAFEGSFFCELSGFFKNSPSPYGMKAIKDSEIYYIKRKDMNILYDLNQKYERLARLIWEEGLIEMSKTLVLHQTEKAADRYLLEIKNNDKLMEVSQKNISSYIGINPSTLSRIRASTLQTIRKNRK